MPPTPDAPTLTPPTKFNRAKMRAVGYGAGVGLPLAGAVIYFGDRWIFEPDLGMEGAAALATILTLVIQAIWVERAENKPKG